MEVSEVAVRLHCQKLPCRILAQPKQTNSDRSTSPKLAVMAHMTISPKPNLYAWVEMERRGSRL